MKDKEEILEIKEVLSMMKIARSSLYNLINKHSFPSPHKIGIRSARWSKKEILAWCKKKGFKF
jgi:prophage regulatory protein